MLAKQVPDIVPMLAFAWFVPIYNKVNNSSFPSNTVKKCGHFADIAKNVGHIMTFKILTDNTCKVILKSNVQSTLDETARNKELDASKIKDIFSGPGPRIR